ncbi:MAG: hypothetical protein NVS3B28_28540 [Candidatus Velthaea sp.]
MSAGDRINRIEPLAAELRTSAAQLAAEPELDEALTTRLGNALHALHDSLDILEPLADGGDLIDDE